MISSKISWILLPIGLAPAGAGADEEDDDEGALEADDLTAIRIELIVGRPLDWVCEEDEALKTSAGASGDMVGRSKPRRLMAWIKLQTPIRTSSPPLPRNRRLSSMSSGTYTVNSRFLREKSGKKEKRLGSFTKARSMLLRAMREPCLMIGSEGCIDLWANL